VHWISVVSPPESSATFVPPGWATITPRVVVRHSTQFLEFLAYVFRAACEAAPGAPAIAHIGTSRLMVSEAGERPPRGAFLYVYVEDADATYRRAMERGARCVEKPLDTPYGDRRCMVEDAWGITWQIATHKPGMAPEMTSPDMR
jgi:uncharacterized glyoxalase superfamily protein PhnB